MPGVLHLPRPPRPPCRDPDRGDPKREHQAHLPFPGRTREAPRRARGDGPGPARRGCRPDPRCQGARRPVRECRIRGCQERAGVRRGPDPDARGADQERHDHRRAPFDRARPDRVDRRPREWRRDGDVHDRRFCRGGPARGQDLERVARRARPPGQEEGRPGHGQGAGRRLRVHDHQDQLSRPTQGVRAIDWADELAASVDGPQVVNDRKTPSGTVHVGSLRGPVILDVIARALRARGTATSLLYGVDDLDPMDAQALLTPDAIEQEMGRPLAHVPDQAGDCHASYARHHAQTFIDTFAGLGIHPDRYYWMSDLYPTGEMDPFIRAALDRAAIGRELYRRVANVQHPADWHPLQVVCESCGKVGTTIVTRWDGERVFYECRANLVTWARGCGHAGLVGPFGGRAKLGWNLEWAAQWSIFGVTIEPSGKDLSTAGGSRDRADAIAREVFEREPPLNVPYEFLNIGGRKMSTSKGLGAVSYTHLTL